MNQATQPTQSKSKPAALYPPDAREALRRWDAGEPVYSIQMAFEEDDEIAIQTVMFELDRKSVV